MEKKAVFLLILSHFIIYKGDKKKKKMLINTQTNKRHELLSNGKGKSRTPFCYHTSEATGISSGICLGSAMFDKDVIPGESTEDKPRDSIKH